jgi:Mn2+/Fe2+ NRAMP family transporter
MIAELMGEHTNGTIYNIAAWLTAIIVSAISLLLIGATIFGSK